MNNIKNVFRTTVIYKNRKWVYMPFSGIKADNKFRLFEPTGEPVIDDFNNTEFTAACDAYLNQDGIWQVNTK